MCDVNVCKVLLAEKSSCGGYIVLTHGFVCFGIGRFGLTLHFHASRPLSPQMTDHFYNLLTQCQMCNLLTPVRCLFLKFADSMSDFEIRRSALEGTFGSELMPGSFIFAQLSWWC